MHSPHRGVLQSRLARPDGGRASCSTSNSGFDEALAESEMVLTKEPANFDALLLRVCLQTNQLVAPETLVARALAVRDDASARYNLNLIQEARRIEVRERGL